MGFLDTPGQVYETPLDRGGEMRRDEKLLNIKSISAVVIRLVHLFFYFSSCFFMKFRISFLKNSKSSNLPFKN